jgi:HEAT repeat protein
MNAGALTAALEVANRWNLKASIAPHIPAIFENKSLPTSARLRAAVYLGSRGNLTAAQFVKDAAVHASEDLAKHPDWQDAENDRLSDIYDYAVEHLPALLHEKALPVLREVARRQGYPIIAYRAMQAIGKKAVPDLIQMLKDDSDPDGQKFAAHILGEVKADSAEAISALRTALHSTATSKSGYGIRGAAAYGLGLIGPVARSAIPELVELARDQDEFVAKTASGALEKIRREKK